MDFERALSAVYMALDSVNNLRAPEEAISPEPNVVLAGGDGSLDSLGLTTLILAIENRLHDLTGRDVSLLDENDFDAQVAAFRTPTTLARLIVEKWG